MTHTIPSGLAAEELVLGWICAVCGEWIPVVDPEWSECSGPADLVAIDPPPCLVCGKHHVPLLLPRERVDAWHGGELIQRAFPDLAPHLREVLISGTHPACFDRLADEGVC